MTFTVNVLLTRILQCDAGPGYNQSCLRVQQVDSYHSCHICPPTFSFGDAIALQSYWLFQRNSNVSCSCLIKLMFLELNVQVYSSFDLFSTTGFKFNSLRASLLTVLRVVYAIIGSEIQFPAHFDWLIVHFQKISEAQLIGGVSCFHSLYRQMFSSIFPPPFPYPLFPSQYGGEFQYGGKFTIASFKKNACTAGQ